MRYFTSNFTPLFEEVCKALPILIYAYMYKPKRRTLLECAILVGVGFAVLENAFILGGAASSVSVANALIRGFGAGMMHGVCTLAVGYGMTFVHTRRKLFCTGTTALLAVAIIYHFCCLKGRRYFDFCTANAAFPEGNGFRCPG